MKLANILLALAALAAGAPVMAQQAPAAEQAAPAPARPPESREQIERRLQSVATLIEQSSAAKQVAASGNAEAQAAQAAARTLRAQAAEAFAKGDLPAASSLLDQAARQLFAGVRLAAPEQVTGAKQQRDFDNRLESVKALLAAQKRIGAEKGKGTADNAALEKKMQDAVALAGSGQLDTARSQLDQVYLAAKLSIEGMRSGDTLVRSLSFANKEEEFRYELDRNDTHKMLVSVLLSEKRAANPSLDSLVQKNLDAAAKLRTEADAAGAKKDFEGAIKLLDESTKELVRAIRGAGVYIPG